MQAKLFRNWSPAVLFDIILSLLFCRWEGGFWVANSVSCPHLLCTFPCWWPCSSPPLPNPRLSVVHTHTPAQAPRAVFSPPKFVTVLMTVETCQMKHLDVHVRMTYLVLSINISYFSLQQDLCWGGWYTLSVPLPRGDKLPFTCFLTLSAQKKEKVQVTLQDFRLGRFQSHLHSGCPDGHLQITEAKAEGLAPPGSGSGSGQFCGITNNKTRQAKAQLDKLFLLHKT